MRWALKNGMSPAVGAPSNYAELTIGGVISANGHGTGSNVTSSMVGHTAAGLPAYTAYRCLGRQHKQRFTAALCMRALYEPAKGIPSRPLHTWHDSLTVCCTSIAVLA